MKKLIRWTLKLSAAVMLSVVLLIGILICFKIPLDLTHFRAPIEYLISEAIDRSISIEKSIVVTTSLSPVFTMEGLRIRDDATSSSTFAYLDHVLIELELVPLLTKKLHLAQISAHRLELNLEERKDGSVNWLLDKKQNSNTAAQHEKLRQQKPYKQKENRGQVSGKVVNDIVVIKNLVLDDIQVTYRTPKQKEPSLFQIASGHGEMLPGQPLVLDLQGTFLTTPYELVLQIASIEELFGKNRSWTEIDIAIAETEFSFSGNINLAEAHKSITLQAGISGANLNSLNGLLGLDLPPLKEYGAQGSLLVRKNHLELSGLLIRTGTSRLAGTAKVTQENAHHNVELDLHASLVQINDFLFEDWSWTDSSTEDKKKTVTTMKNRDKKAGKKLFDPQLLALANVTGSVRADQVLSGEDDLGSGYLGISLLDGRIAIDPLELHIPGGSINVTLSLKPGPDNSIASLNIKMHNFDIGILVHRKNPGSDMGGLINLDVELTASASSLEQLTDNGRGHFDFSGQLTNMKAGIIDLWAVNLVSAIISSTDKQQSQLNCTVGRWSVNDGILTPEVFLIDTSKMRICGTGSVNFRSQNLDLTVSPKAKKAEFFSLATPLRVRGSFNDIGIGIKSGGLAGTVLRFITSPITTPIKRIILDRLPTDGSDVCSMSLGPSNRKNIEVPGCQ